MNIEREQSIKVVIPVSNLFSADKLVLEFITSKFLAAGLTITLVEYADDKACSISSSLSRTSGVDTICASASESDVNMSSLINRSVFNMTDEIDYIWITQPYLHIPIGKALCLMRGQEIIYPISSVISLSRDQTTSLLSSDTYVLHNPERRSVVLSGGSLLIKKNLFTHLRGLDENIQDIKLALDEFCARAATYYNTTEMHLEAVALSYSRSGKAIPAQTAIYLESRKKDLVQRPQQYLDSIKTVFPLVSIEALGQLYKFSVSPVEIQNTNELFTVIMPIHNWSKLIGERGVEKVLSAVFEETNAPLVKELLIVDDHSDGDVKTLCKSIINGMPKVRYIDLLFGNPSGGNRALVRNYGASLAATDYLQFIDQDSILTANYFRALVEYIRHLGDNVAIRGHRIFEITRRNRRSIPTSSFIPTNFDICECEYVKNSGWCYEVMSAAFGHKENLFLDCVNGDSQFIHAAPNLHLNPMDFISYSFFITRNNFLRVGGFDTRFSGWGEEDVEFGCRLSEQGILPLSCDRNLFVLHAKHPIDKQSRISTWIINNIIFGDSHPRFADSRKKLLLASLAQAIREDEEVVRKKICLTFARYMERMGIPPNYYAEVTREFFRGEEGDTKCSR